MTENGKTRIRIEIRCVREYDARFEDYETNDPAEIAAMDKAAAEEDVYLFLDSEDAEWTIDVNPVATVDAS